MLKKLRIALATLVFCAMVLLFLGLWDGSQVQLSFLAKIQFVPALLAVNLLIIATLVIITLLFGRIYCSVICPLGILQDIIARIGRFKKKNPYSASKEKKIRYIIMVLFYASIIAGLNYLVVTLDPYGLFGKMAASAGGKAIGTLVPAVAAVAFVIIAVLAWRNGRTWCNTICPVGTTLGLFSRFALFRPVIDKDKCKNCHVCEKKCKAACIDIANKKIDYSRCVACFDCLEDCKFGALKYRFAFRDPSVISSEAEGEVEKSQSDASRRAFLSSAVMATTAATLGAQGKKLDGGLAAIIDKEIPEREAPLTPFGSNSVKEFYQKCVSCQLCISACPNNVLRPSTSLDKLMQPEMGYEKGYCRPECTECSQVCPSGAILPITPEEKTQFHIGTAKVERSLCIAEEGISCGNCARHCPVGAILMVQKDPADEDSPIIPAVDESRCIGCGACEYLCPARPFSAIKVNGLQVHIKE